jgi:hypothetical protein
MGYHHPDIAAVFFDPDGVFLEFRARPAGNEATSKKVYHVGPSECAPSRESVDLGTAAWQRAIGFQPGRIAVREFFLPDQHIGIEPLPRHYVEFLRDPSLVTDDQERQDWYSDIRDWKEKGAFVLHWEGDLFMDAAGDVTSS